MKRIYLSGAMTGVPELNFPAFHAAAKALRERGLVVVNPAEIKPEGDPSWSACMRADLKVMLDSLKGIVFEDDKFVHELHGRRAEPDGDGRLVVTI